MEPLVENAEHPDNNRGGACTKACLMYLSMSLAKINVFISLIGLVMMAIDSSSIEMVTTL